MAIYTRFGVEVELKGVTSNNSGDYAHIQDAKDSTWEREDYPLYWLQADNGIEEIETAILKINPEFYKDR